MFLWVRHNRRTNGAGDEIVDCNLAKLFKKSIDLPLLNANNEFVMLKTCSSPTLASHRCLRADLMSLGGR